VREFDTSASGGGLGDAAIALAPIRATLIGSYRYEALGITGRGYAPVFALCRALVAAGHDPRRPLHAYRRDVLALGVNSIGEGAKLTVREDRAGPRFVRWEPFPRRVKSRTREKAEGVDRASDVENEPGARPRAAAAVPTKTKPSLRTERSSRARGRRRR
jgi:hypothetical protein